MAKGKTVIAAATVVAASLFALVGTSQAVTFPEPGDAGQTLATAQYTGTNNTTSLTMITGTFNGTNDADLYVIDITNPATFYATTVNTATNVGGQDTALFLFSATGVAIATNDDSSGTSTDAALPSGNTLYASLGAGTYYLGISESGNEAVNSANQLLFNGYPGGDTTAVRGAASGVNPTTLATFNGNSFGGGAGAYEIDLGSVATDAAVPEPSTWIVVVASLGALGFLRRHRVA